MSSTNTRHMNGGYAVVDCLRNEGVRHLFNVPGESFTSILDGMRDVNAIRLISNRQEGGACLMAEAYAKASRQPGVCGDPWSGRHQRQHRGALRTSRFHAVSLVSRAGGASGSRTRGRARDRLLPLFLAASLSGSSRSTIRAACRKS